MHLTVMSFQNLKLKHIIMCVYFLMHKLADNIKPDTIKYFIFHQTHTVLQLVCSFPSTDGHENIL